MPAESTAMLRVDVRKSYPDFELAVNAEIALDGVTGLFGASGSGKSTLLRIIAGFERDVSGSVRMADEVWIDSADRTFVPPFRRPVGYVFQDARLFVHLNVAGNLSFAEQRSSGIGPVFSEVIAALDLQPLLERAVTKLSGGERQRVALGRTLLCKPRLLLLDEPLAALDMARKQEILPYLETLHERFGIPTVYVSHSVDEIVRLADRVIVLRDGQLHAEGDTASVLDTFLADDAGAGSEVSSVLEARVVRHVSDLHLAELDFRGQRLFVPSVAAREPGHHVVLRVRASDVALATERPSGISVRNVLQGTVQRIDEQRDGAFALITVDIADVSLRAQITRHALQAMQLTEGMEIFALLKSATFAGRLRSASEDAR